MEFHEWPFGRCNTLCSDTAVVQVKTSLRFICFLACTAMVKLWQSVFQDVIRTCNEQYARRSPICAPLHAIYYSTLFCSISFLSACLMPKSTNNLWNESAFFSLASTSKTFDITILQPDFPERLLLTTIIELIPYVVLLLRFPYGLSGRQSLWYVRSVCYHNSEVSLVGTWPLP